MRGFTQPIGKLPSGASPVILPALVALTGHVPERRVAEVIARTPPAVLAELAYHVIKTPCLQPRARIAVLQAADLSAVAHRLPENAGARALGLARKELERLWGAREISGTVRECNIEGDELDAEV